LNRILDEVLGRYDYLLHLEDDWHFFQEDTFISKALSVMASNDSIAEVMFNPNIWDTDADWRAESAHSPPTKMTPDGTESVPTSMWAGWGLLNGRSTYISTPGASAACSTTLDSVCGRGSGGCLPYSSWGPSLTPPASRSLIADKLHAAEYRVAFLPRMTSVHLAMSARWMQDKDVTGVYERHGLTLKHKPNSRPSAYDLNLSPR